MKKIILLMTGCIVALMSCSKDSSPDPDPNIVVTMSAIFSVQDTQGNDLLDGAALDISAIRTSYLDENRKMVQFSNFLYTHTYGYELLERSITPEWTGLNGKKLIAMGMYGYRELSEDGTSATSTNFIHWSEGVTDTLECKYEIGKNYNVISEILINGEILWQKTLSNAETSAPYFKIIISEDGQRTISVISRT